MTKGAKKSVSRRPRTHAARRGIAERGGWVDQRVAEILKSPLPPKEKARLVYELLAAEPPVGGHRSPIDVIRIRLSLMFPTLAEGPDGPLTSENMGGTVFLVLEKALQSWTPVTNGHKRRDGDGCASFITYLTNRLKWACQRYLEEARNRSREIPLSVLLERGWGDRDAIDEDRVWGLGVEPITEDPF